MRSPSFRALASYTQFIVYRLEPSKTRPGKTDKFPIDHRTGRKHDAHDPAIWLSFTDASAAADRLGEGHGVGFVFTDSDPFFFVDLDDCLQDGGWSAVAKDVCARLYGAAVEVSQSGRGLHIIGRYTSIPEHACEVKGLGGMYHTGRFCALTDLQSSGDAGADLTGPLADVIAQYYPPGPAVSSAPTEWSAGPREDWNGPADDDELITKARASTGGIAGAVFGSRATFEDLWTANGEALGKAYPDEYGARLYDESRADAALASRLAFWTGCDCERIERLMWRSELVRDKWVAHSSYLNRTILGAVGRCETVYTGRVNGTAVKTELTAELAEGLQYMPLTQQVEHFKGCTYVQDMHRIFTPRGSLLRPDQFRATYGGYQFVLDAYNNKTTKSAWEAFTESQAVRYPIAEGMTFRPECRPGEMLTEEGRPVINSYTPANVRQAKGSVAPFLDHMERLLPDTRDRAITLAYLAACVQHIGVKFQWAPLYQGTPGNGKTLLTRCAAYAVGLKYTHWPKAKEIGTKFNSWMVGKVLIGVEDVYVPGHREDILIDIYPLITNDILPIEPKGVDQVSVHVCANFILNCNRKDGLRKTVDDRRFAVFYTPQQSYADAVRDGMGGGYFPALYDWLKADGYARVAEYLYTYEIPDDLNPATTVHRAPDTSSTAEAIAHGAGRVEQAVLEAVEEGRPGFAGGWISSMALDRLLDGMRMGSAVPPNRRREMLRTLGYDWHPALVKGRVNTPTLIDQGKPRLFIAADHADRGLSTSIEVVQAYQAAQVLA